jgi:hypothetical protein
MVSLAKTSLDGRKYKSTHGCPGRCSWGTVFEGLHPVSALQARQIDDKNISMEGNSIKGLTNLGERLQGETVKL